MSIAVPLDELAATLEKYPWGYIVTVGDDSRAKSIAVPTQFVDGELIVNAGRGTLMNAEARPNVTFSFPGPTGQDLSLIVDGEARVDGDTLRVTPTWAVLHRPALPGT